MSITILPVDAQLYVRSLLNNEPLPNKDQTFKTNEVWSRFGKELGILHVNGALRIADDNFKAKVHPVDRSCITPAAEMPFEDVVSYLSLSKNEGVGCVFYLTLEQLQDLYDLGLTVSPKALGPALTEGKVRPEDRPFREMLIRNEMMRLSEKDYEVLVDGVMKRDSLEFLQSMMDQRPFSINGVQELDLRYRGIRVEYDYDQKKYLFSLFSDPPLLKEAEKPVRDKSSGLGTRLRKAFKL